MAADTHTPAQIALKPCPFCGGTDLRLETYSIQPDDYWGGSVRCNDCDAEGGRPECWHDEHDVADEVRAAWNRRAEVEKEAGR